MMLHPHPWIIWFRLAGEAEILDFSATPPESNGLGYDYGYAPTYEREHSQNDMGYADEREQDRDAEVG